MTRAASQFRSIVEQSLTETELAIREVHTTHREMVGKYEAMVAADNETKYLVARWQALPGLDDSATLLLEDLLDSQERLADEESAFVQAQVNYSVSFVRLRKAMGTLLRFDQPTSVPVTQPHDQHSQEEVLPPRTTTRIEVPSPPWHDRTTGVQQWSFDRASRPPTTSAAGREYRRRERLR